MPKISTPAPPARATAPTPAHPENLKQALSLAERGCRVFPLIENRIDPVFDSFYDRASSDPAVITDWFTGLYRNCNVAVLTGDNLIVFDFDCKKGAKGLESLALMELVGFDPSFSMTTRSGGRHIYFRLGENDGEIAGSQGALEDFPGIDVRCHHNYVAAAGSVINGQTYTIREDLPIVPAPAWMIQLAKNAASRVRERAGSEPLIELDTEPSIQRAIMYLKDDAPAAQEGAGGDATTFAVAARVKDYGVSESMCFDLMDHHWNEQKAFPTWSPEELEMKIANAYAYGTSSPGVLDARAEFDAVEIDEPANDNRAPLVFTRPVEFGDLQPPPRESLVEGMVPLHKTTLLTGDGGVGKTLAAQQLATAVSSNRLWFGREVKPGRVLCVFSEDDLNEIWRRQVDINRSMDITMDDLGGMNLWTAEDIPAAGCVMMSFPRDNPEGKLMPFFKRLQEAVVLLQPTLVVVDPIANMFGGNELSRTEVTGFMNRTLNRLCIEHKTTVVALAHPSVAGIAENSGRSGSTGWANASRSRLFMSRPKEDPVGDYRTIRTTKANYGKMGTEVKVRWDRGAFIATDGQDPAMATDRALLAALRVLAGRGEWFSPKKKAGNFALTSARASPEIRGYDRDSLEASYERLLRSGAVSLSVGTRQSQGHRYDEIVIRESSEQEVDDVFGE